MTAQQSLDLVHELQLELGWKPDFAHEAHAEYMKWLRLRSQSGDFLNCKLPPSRVVAMIWNLHRQWTLDYEQTCLQLGGFIHHFPPAMRMNLAREQAYAATVHTYKTIFKRDPPSAYWGPAIYPYKPLTSNNDAIQPAPARETPSRRSLPSLRRSPVKRDTTRPSTATGKGKAKSAENLSRRNSANPTIPTSNPTTERSRSTADEGRPGRRSSKSAKETKSTPPISSPADTDMKDAPNSSAKKTRRKFPGSSLYVLKPLRPGEKRKRGRPSFSDYMLATGAEALPVHEPKRRDSRASATEKAPTPKSPATSTHSLRRRKTATTPVARFSLTPTIKKEKSQSGPTRRGRLSAAAKQAASSTAGAVVSAARSEAKNTSKATGASASTKAAASSARTEENDGAILIKRPRGRPRKDGSWPVPRGRKTDAASKPAPSVASKPAPSVAVRAQQQKQDAVDNAKEKTKERKRDAPKPTPALTNVQPPVPPTVPVVRTSAAIPASGTGLPAGGVTVPSTVTVPSLPRKDVPSNGTSNGTNGNSNAPSKVIETGDIGVRSLADKAAPKPSALQVPEHVPRDGMFDQVMEPSGFVDRERQGDATNALLGKNVQVGQDVVFPQSEPIAERMDMDNPLGSAPRQDPIPTVPVSGVAVGAPPPPGADKFMPHVEAFQMPVMPVNPVPNPMDGGILPLGPPGVPPKPDAGIAKNGAELDIDDDESKKPFKRPRGRPRKEMAWPNTRPRPMGEEAAERVKDLNDPAPPLNFPMGPPGTV